MNNLQKNSKPSLKVGLQPDAKKAGFYANVTRFPEVEIDSNPTVIVSNALQAQISILHSKFGNIEWSGFLLYSIDSGSYEDAANMVITAQEVFPCDVGSAAYTEYDPGDFIIDMDELTDFLMKGWKLGHIHTHHTMACFFSGTDMSELHSNVGNYKDNFYLSLIVNKTHDVAQYCAKVAKLGTKTQFTPRFRIKGRPFGVSSKKEVAAMHHMDCNIESSIKKGWFDQIKVITPVYKPYVYTRPAGNWVSGSSWNPLTQVWEVKKESQLNVDQSRWPTDDDDNLDDNWTNIPYVTDIDEGSTTKEEALECFFTYWLGASLEDNLPEDDFNYYSETIQSLLLNVTDTTKALERFTRFFMILVGNDIGGFKEWFISDLELLNYAKSELEEAVEGSISHKEIKQFINAVNYLIDLKIDLK